MSTTIHLVTADELFKTASDDFRYELQEGVLKRMPPTGFEHGVVVVNLTLPLAQHVKTNNLGLVCGAETGFRLASNPDTVLAPDIAFVRRERVNQNGRTSKFWEGAPDLAVEIMSPNDTVREMKGKADKWLAAGAQAVWIVNPLRRTVTVCLPSGEVVTLTENDTLDGGTVVPGFRCSVREIFA